MNPTTANENPRLAARLGLWLRAAFALLVILALAAGVPWLLAGTVGNPIPASLREQGLSWTGPVGNDTILGVLAIVVWLFWAQMIVCLLIEIVAELRLAAGRSADWMTQVPGTFGAQQHLARVLVHAVVAIGIGTSLAAAPGLSGVAHAAPAQVEPAQIEPQATELPPAVASLGPADTASQVQSASGSEHHRQSTLTVEVVKGDTLWSIAEQHLGSGERWRHIAGLNEGRIMSDGQPFAQASSIQPGWQLLIPDPHDQTTTVRPDEVTVDSGDTLWSLADQAYGHGQDWSRLYHSNRAQIADPDVIYPGQVLRVPDNDVLPAGAEQQPRQPDEVSPPSPAPQPDHPHESQPAAPEPAETPDRRGADAANTPASPARRAEAPAADASDHGDDRNLTAALIGGGGLLASGALVMFLAHRRRQFRSRRSGRTIASTPSELVAAEVTLRSTGSAGGVAARFLDQALRDLSFRLADSGAALPDVAAVRLGDDRLDLLLASPPASQPPPPWTNGTPNDDTVDRGRGRWTLLREVSLQDRDVLAPYPALVAIGTADDGATWLLDLEAAGLMQLLGDRAACEDLARFIGAELALNMWSDDVDVTLAGFAEELAGLNPARLRCVEQADVDRLIKTARRVHEGAHAMGCDVLGGRLDGAGGDTWMPTILLANPGSEPDLLRDDTARLLDELAATPGRDAVAFVTIGEVSPSADGATLTLDEAGHIVLSPWKIQLTANRLAAADARTLAGLISAADEAEDEPMPPASGAQPFEQVSDAAGALRTNLTDPRNRGGDHGSLLPLADEQYLAAAATTPGDLGALAPNVPGQALSREDPLDPALDEDINAWSDPATTRPRLRLLGPVEVRATGERKPDVDRRCAYYTELAAYLATRPNGTTPQQVAEVFGVQTNTLHSRIGILRKWLGTDPTAGSWHLPESTLSPSAKARGVPVYELVGLLCDADLFKRLRVRGQTRGPDGIEDLIAALQLVDGMPYDQLRPGGYGWLAATPLDQYLTAAVVDVAHLVATHALATGNGDLALWASERAVAAAPAEDKPRLDLARALAATGRGEEADNYVRAEIYNRSDDGGPPPLPSDRTTDILQAQERIRREGDSP